MSLSRADEEGRLAMEAGPALDKLVAEKVMGFVVAGDVCYQVNGNRWRGVYNQVHAYSTEDRKSVV